MRNHFIAGLLLAAGLGGCDGLGGRLTHYRIRVHCVLAPDGKPVAGVRLGGAGPGPKPPPPSDAEGNAVFEVEGREGQEVLFEIVETPVSLALADGAAKRSVVLKNFGDGSRASELSHEVRLRTRKEQYVVLVSAEQAPGVEISTSTGTEPVARLNSRSAAAFVTEGKPGDELTVTLLASRVSKLKASDPMQTFVLKGGDNLLAFHSDLYVKPVAVAAPRKVRRAPSVVSPIRPW